MKINRYVMLLLALMMSVNLAAKADAVSELEAVNSAMVRNFNSGEITALTNIYANDAVMLPPSSEILSGPGTIKGYWEQLRKVGVNEYSLYLVDLKVDGNIAYTTSLWEASRKTSGDEVITMEGNISNVFEKQKDGSWKIKLQSWN